MKSIVVLILLFAAMVAWGCGSDSNAGPTHSQRFEPSDDVDSLDHAKFVAIPELPPPVEVKAAPFPEPLPPCLEPTSFAYKTWFHALQEPLLLSSTDDCSVYTSGEPRQWRIDSEAPAPVRADGHDTCAWRARQMYGAGQTDNSICVLRLTFACGYSSGTLLYVADIRNDHASTGNWLFPSLMMRIYDLSGTVFGGCRRAVQTNFYVRIPGT